LLAIYLAVGWLGWGAGGAAMATSLALVVMHFVLIWPMGLRLVGGSWGDFLRRTLLPGLAPIAAAIALCLGIDASTEITSWWGVAGAGAAAISVYLAVLFTCCLDATDRGLLASLRGGLRRRLRKARAPRARVPVP
jgi:hypothetical protein